MGVDSWCFCKGVGKSEKMKGAIFTSKSSAIAHVGGALSGTGFLIHRNLLVTTHGNLNSVSSAEASEIRLRDGVAASLFPHRFQNFEFWILIFRVWLIWGFFFLNSRVWLICVYF